jgi:DNA ligase D
MTPRSPASIEVTRPDKLLWPDLGLTKRRYVDYLGTVADDALPWLRDRPLTLVRGPDGVTGSSYYQKQISDYAPPWIRRVRLAAPSAGRDVDHVVCNDATTLAWLGNQASLELHMAPVRADRLDRPDLLVVDIDPPDGAFDAAVEVALLVLDALDDHGLRSGIKTTGGKGLHVVVPFERRVDASGLRRAATTLTEAVTSRRPDLATDAFRKADRGGRVMLDPSRNGPGATIVAPYSPRARDGGSVSFPVVAEDLPDARPEMFTLATVPDLLGAAGPRHWRALLDHRQRLPASLLHPGR